MKKQCQRWCCVLGWCRVWIGSVV